MRKFQKVLTIVIVIAAVVLAGIMLGWWGSRGEKLPSTPTIAETTTPPAVTEPIRLPTPLPEIPHPRVEPLTNTSPTQVSTTDTNLIADWDDKLEQIVGADGVAEAEKAKQLIELFPHVPEEGQVEVAQHLSNLVPDENYAPMGKFLKDDKLPEAVLDVLMADALNRPNSLKLPVLMDVARDPQNPKATEAKDLLELFLEEDYGSDWTKWQAKMEQWLKDNPD